MFNFGSVRSHFVFLTFLAVLCWAGAMNAPAASGGPLEGVVSPVKEAVGGRVGEVVETVAPPVRETTEAVTAPVQEVTQAVPPVREVTEVATAPVEPVTETVTPPAKAVTETVSHASASPPVKLPSAPVTQVVGTAGKAVSSPDPTTSATEGVNRAAPEAARNVTQSTPTTSQPASSSPLSADRTAQRQGDSFVPSPARNGSTSAPLPKWVAYIWPAVALVRSGLADLVSRWETAVRIALATSEGSVAGESTGIGPVVAGVHATGGRPRAEDSSSSPLSKIATAVGHFPYNASGAILGYILIVGIMVIALFVAVRWEIARGRREGRG
ncbi:MAG TPA: hypothetical protein VGH14_18190 [Solirubrobacterales bacterium]|jgi:hypothetical protein